MSSRQAVLENPPKLPEEQLQVSFFPLKNRVVVFKFLSLLLTSHLNGDTVKC